jgi:hypothetical protein
MSVTIGGWGAELDQDMIESLNNGEDVSFSNFGTLYRSATGSIYYKNSTLY